MADLSFRIVQAATARYVIQVTRCATAALALAVVVAAPASASTRPTTPAARAAIPGSLGLRLLNVPFGAREDPRARLYIVDHLHPGTIIHRLIEASNTTASTMPIILYPAAATIDSGRP